MPLVLMLGGVLLQISQALVGRVLLALALSFVTYTGVGAFLSSLQTVTLSNLDGLPAQLLGLMAYMKVDVCVNMLISTYAVKLALSSLSASGSITR